METNRDIMTKQEYEEAARYACSHLEQWQVEYALEELNERRPLPYGIKELIGYHMDEWCGEHGIEYETWLDHGDEEDIFFVGTDK